MRVSIELSFIRQVEITDDDKDVMENTNILVLALGLTFAEQNCKEIPFIVPKYGLGLPDAQNESNCYYNNIQNSVYK